MHELSIVQGIVAIAEEQFRKHNSRKIEKIEIEIGSLSGVMLESLNFVWDIGVRDSVLAETEKEFHFIQAQCKCGTCGDLYDVNTLFDACPQCGEFLNELVCGKELRVKTLTIT